MVFAPERRRPKALVHFLGGAFVASTPHLVVSDHEKLVWCASCMAASAASMPYLFGV